MYDRFGVGLYSPRMAARIARVSYQNFQAWAKANLLRPVRVAVNGKAENTYTYSDLLLIRLIVRLKEQGAKPRQIRVALDTIAMMAEGSRDAWLRATLLMDSGVVVAILPDKPEWNPIAASRGPQTRSELVEPRMALVFFPKLAEELQRELVPPDQFPHIEVNPEILGGAPVIKGTRIPTSAVVAAIESGQNPRALYPSISEQQAKEAQQYEEFLAAA